MIAYFYCMAYIGCFILRLFIGGVAGLIDGRASERKKGNRNGSKEHNS